MWPFQLQALLAYLDLPTAYHRIQYRSNFYISLYAVTIAILSDVTTKSNVLCLFYDSVSARQEVGELWI